MLSYLTGSKLSALAERFLGEMDANPLSNPLKPEIFIVQNHGMALWLSRYIAERRGIAANLKFEFPAERIWKLIRTLEADIPKTLPSDRVPMTWAILQILRNDNDSRLEVLHQYVAEDDHARKEMRRWKLAGRIADVYDQYLTYRPELVISWQDDTYVPKDASERWQSVLWEKLINLWAGGTEIGYPHRALLQQQVIEAIDSETIDLEKLPERITVFGVSAMPPIYLEVLVKLSRLIDVSFYVLGPEKQISHPIAVSLAKTGNEYRELLERFIAKNEIQFEKELLDEGLSPKGACLLHAFQAELLDEETTADDPELDDSIQVHSCHSARREVEVLYDRLLAMFDEDETLQPSEVLVLTPDLGLYATEIEAVFGTGGEADVPEIPFHLADRYIGRANPIVNTVKKLLQLVDSRFTVTEVLDLLDSDPIQHTFELSDDHLGKLEQWIDDTHIRWGKDGEAKATLNLPESNSYTWTAGLHRMILGYAMRQNEDRLFEGIYPYQQVEQSEDALLAGRFYNLMESLFHFHEEAKKPRTLTDWGKLLFRQLAVFLPEDDYYSDLQKVRELIANLGEQQELSGFTGKVPFRVIRSYLLTELENKKEGGGRGGRGVSFGSIVQMRNIPARIICLLGLNDGSFPRSKMPIAFDLMNRDPRPGDRSHSKEDRQLFLETLLAAHERIYFSYIGQSNTQDTTYPPSVILRELIDYLKEDYGIKETKLLTEHPLQPFSPKYFKKETENAGLFSYSYKNKAIADKLAEQSSMKRGFMEFPLPEPDAEYSGLSDGEMIRFFVHPSRYLLQNRLGIYFDNDKVLEEDREPFQLDGLVAYHLGQEMLQRFLNNQPIDNYRQVARATDMIPEGWPGEEAFEQKKLQVHDFGQNLQNILEQEKLDAIEVDLHFNDFRLTGRLDQIYSKEQVFYRFGSMRPKDLIELWIKHLVFQQVKPESHTGTSRLYTRGKRGSVEYYQIPELELTHTKNILEELLQIYWTGLQRKTFFFPGISFAFAHEVCFRNNEPEKGLKAAAPRWHSEYSPYPKEGDDPYNKLLMGEDNPLDDRRFQDISISFWRPFFEVLNNEEV